MPFVKVDMDYEIEKRCKEDSDFRLKWDESREEYELIKKICEKQNEERKI